jgi:hypothetical protein
MTIEQKNQIIADYLAAIAGKNIGAELVKASVDAIMAL